MYPKKEKERFETFFFFLICRFQFCFVERERERERDFLVFVCGTLWVLYSKTITWIKPTLSYTLKEDNFFYKNCNSFSILISKNIIFYPLANMGIINIFISKDTFLLVNI